ncbi:MAG: aldo/keto reductase [Solirubrobacteraceae bacterium]|jgi:aryl-alcohol dehydrogenase-like predicted oxidoreductase|nr:aldo/keto reductase [Solirubrobacteraceae bacterium]
MAQLTHTALGSWSGGRFMNFGTEIEEERLLALLRPGDGVDTLVTADVYGQGGADVLVGRALAGLPRDAYRLAGTIGHDFYTGQRAGAKGFPRFTNPELREPADYGGYLRMACERSLERCGVDRFDLLMLHNPDRVGYTSETVWEGMRALRDAGLTDMIGVAPGPANGFTLDVIDCFERFGDELDWAMIILNPFEPWPGELVIPAAEHYGVNVLARVVDFGGVFHDDVKPGHAFGERDHRTFRPAGWVEDGAAKLERIRPIAERHGLTMLQLAAQWTLAHAPVKSVVPTLIQEVGDDARPVEDKRAELAALPPEVVLSASEVEEIRAIGDNTGCMALKGGVPNYDGEPVADNWPLDGELEALAGRWSIDPRRELQPQA